MSRYLIFAFSEHHPSGGINDCVLKTSFGMDIIMIFEDLLSSEKDYFQVYDTKIDHGIGIDLKKERSVDWIGEVISKLHGITNLKYEVVNKKVREMIANEDN